MHISKAQVYVWGGSIRKRKSEPLIDPVLKQRIPRNYYTREEIDIKHLKNSHTPPTSSRKNWDLASQIARDIESMPRDRAEAITHIIERLKCAPYIDVDATCAANGIRPAVRKITIDRNATLAHRIGRYKYKPDRNQQVLAYYPDERKQCKEEIFVRFVQPSRPIYVQDSAQLCQKDEYLGTFEELLDAGSFLRFAKRENFVVVALGKLAQIDDVTYAPYIKLKNGILYFGFLPCSRVTIPQGHFILAVRKTQHTMPEELVTQKSLF